MGEKTSNESLEPVLQPCVPDVDTNLSSPELKTRDRFTKEDIPDDFIVKNPDLFDGCDFRKNGLEIFPDNEKRLQWIEKSIEAFNNDQLDIRLIVRSLNDALESKIVAHQDEKKGLLNPVISSGIEYRSGELSKFPEEVEKIVTDKTHYVKLILLAREIPFIRELEKREDDQIAENSKKYGEYYSYWDNNNLLFYLSHMGVPGAMELRPKSFAEAKKRISADLSKNLDLADFFVEKLDDYYQQLWAQRAVTKAIQHYSVARKFVDAAKNFETVWKNENWVKNILKEAQTVIQKHESSELEGLRELDPYENDPWRFTAEQAKKATIVAQIFEGNVDEERAIELGIDVKAIKSAIKYFDDTITLEICYVGEGKLGIHEVTNNEKLGEEDKKAIIKSEVDSIRLTPIVSVVRNLIARYLIQELGDINILGDEKKLRNFLVQRDYPLEPDNENSPRLYESEMETKYTMKWFLDMIDYNVRNIGYEGCRRYIKALEVDVPLYDKLYEEFDNLRETGRSPLEVYLGRDGIYAWIGRRAQDVARRRKMGLEGRKKLKEMGEVIEINPQYTVYPRYFRDNINYETKRQFLEQEGISPDADPLFYDTGYTGTIPEQIMKIMDFDEADIERRIRLLSAPSAHRRVKGIAENARSEIIEYIEHNAKTEESAEGLIVDKNTGKIRSIAKPTSPREQFYFMMVKQAIARHYWLQEKLHHEPSGNINLDSEHYAIRIRQDYAKLLPQEFLHDPKAFFAGHGELMKGGKGEGEYPDEEVTLFKLIDGTEIVAKRIELRKAKEARKEFTILIAAKKAGLPTAEPVGFLSGKEDADGSYLLMKKLEGRSGQKFEKELKEAGKYSDEQIKGIMKQVAEKNKEMAELFRTTLKIDKRWRIKDTIIEFNEETGEVESIVPIDWERAQDYNPNTPKEIDEIT
jgi:hypothetical protein